MASRSLAAWMKSGAEDLVDGVVAIDAINLRQVQELTSEELDAIAARVTSSQLRDFSAGAAMIGTGAALVGAEPIGAGAFAVPATSLEVAALIDAF